MTAGGDRLEQALEIWLRYRSAGEGTPAELLDRHPELRDLIEPLLDEGDPVAGAAAEADDSSPREHVLGGYRLVREIGRGGMGVVWEARQTALGRDVAVKVLTPDFSAMPSRVARFKREALTLARLEHPGIVRVLDVASTDGVHWFAMELVDGESLDRRIDGLRAEGHRGDSLRAMVVIAVAVAEALGHAHDAGVVHRDVKPSNILLRADGRAVLGDFGLAREEGLPTMTVDGAITGTPDYLAPELIKGGSRAGEARSDVFALGATLYEALTLRRPFAAPTVAATLERIVRREPDDPRRVNRDIPPDLAAIVLCALEKDQHKRYQTAAAFAADLQAFLDLRPVAARAVSRIARLRRWCRREPLRATLAALLAVGIPTVAGLAGYLLASAGDIRAGRTARDDSRFEGLLAEGFLGNMTGNRDAAFAAFETACALRPDDDDAIAGLVLAHSKFDGPAAGMALLQPRLRRGAGRGADDELGRLELFLLRRLGREPEAQALAAALGPPRTPSALEITGASLVLPGGAIAMVDAARQALPLLSLAVRTAPRPRAVYVAQWAACAQVAGDAAASRESAETLLALWPDRAFAQHIAAHNLQFTDPERALACQERALALGADDAIAHLNHSAYLYKCGRLDEALDAARVACARDLGHAGDPRDPRVRSHLVALLWEKGEPEPLRAVCEQWVRDLPDSSKAHQELGKCLLRHFDRAAGLVELQQAAELTPHDVAVLYDLAVGHDAQGELREAVAALQQALAVEPRSEQAHAHLASLLTELGDAGAVRAEQARWARERTDDTAVQTDYARFLLDLPDATPADRADAVAAALSADRLSGGRDAAVLEVLARAYTANGEELAAEHCRARARALAPGAAGAAGR